MNSACQIRMFVNAPKAYANRKYQNRVGNSKRGRTKDSDAGNGPSKIRKLNRRPVTRAPRGGSNKVAEIEPHVRLGSQPREVSLFQCAQARFSTPSVFASSPAQRLGPSQDFPSIQSRIHAMSPPPMSSPYAPRISTLPPQLHTPLMSPPALSHGNHSAPASPDNGQLILNPESDQWPPMQQYDNVYYHHDEPLFDGSWGSSDGQQGQACTGANANLFVQHPEMADTAVNLKQQPNRAYDSQGFSQYWETQQGVQRFPYPGTSDIRDQF